MNVIAIKDAGDKVVLIIQGRGTELPAEVAVQVGRELLSKGREVMSRRPQEMDRTIKDQGLLMRAGIPLALTKNAKALDAAATEAQWGRELRKNLPKSVTASVEVHAPELRFPTEGDKVNG